MPKNGSIYEAKTISDSDIKVLKPHSLAGNKININDTTTQIKVKTDSN